MIFLVPGLPDLTEHKLTISYQFSMGGTEFLYEFPLNNAFFRPQLRRPGAPSAEQSKQRTRKYGTPDDRLEPSKYYKCITRKITVFSQTRPWNRGECATADNRGGWWGGEKVIIEMGGGESQSAWIGMLVGYPATCAFVGLVTHRINLHYNPKVSGTAVLEGGSPSAPRGSGAGEPEPGSRGDRLDRWRDRQTGRQADRQAARQPDS